MSNSSWQPLVVLHHEPNLQNANELLSAVRERMTEFLNDPKLRLIYLNPEVSILSETPTERFAHRAEKQRKTWCIRAKRTLGRNWVGTQRFLYRKKGCSKDEAYWLAASVSCGFLIVDHRLIHPDRWKQELIQVSQSC